MPVIAWRSRVLRSRKYVVLFAYISWVALIAKRTNTRGSWSPMQIYSRLCFRTVYSPPQLHETYLGYSANVEACGGRRKAAWTYVSHYGSHRGWREPKSSGSSTPTLSSAFSSDGNAWPVCGAPLIAVGAVSCPDFDYSSLALAGTSALWPHVLSQTSPAVFSETMVPLTGCGGCECGGTWMGRNMMSTRNTVG